MSDRLPAVLRSEKLRATLSYPFRIVPSGQKWKSTPFAGLAVVNGLSGAGDAMVTVALAGSVFVSVSLNAARGRTALGLLCTVLPFAVVGPFVGPAIDRVRGGRKFIVFLAAIGRIAACLMMAAWIHSLFLFLAAFVSLVCSKTHSIAKAALVPGVVDREQDLVKANAKLAVGGSIVTSLAGAIAAGLYRLAGSHVVLDVDVIVFSAAAGLSLYLLSGSKEPVGPWEPNRGIPESDGPPPRRRGLIGGIATAFSARPNPAVPRDVIMAQIAMAGMRAVAGFMTALVVFAFREQGAPVIWYGLVGVASIGGNFGGALVAPRVRDRFTERTLVAAAALLIAATAVAVTQMDILHRRPAALILAFVVGLGASVAKAAFDAIVQSETKDADRSRLFARFESIFQLVWVIGAMIPTLVDTPLLAGYAVVAVVVIATSSGFVLGIARERREERSAAGTSPPQGAGHGFPDPTAGGAPGGGAPGRGSDVLVGEIQVSPPVGGWGPVPAPYPSGGPPQAPPPGS